MGAESASIQRITLYIPSKDKDGTHIDDRSRWVEEALGLLARIGGGATAFPPVEGA
jgi:hypothetical protein